MSATDLVQALVSPAEKLIDAVSGAIGRACEPGHIRKIADARAYEIQKISEVARNNSDIPISYESKGILINTEDFDELIKRVSSRLAYQEINKQINIDAVVKNAYVELQEIECVSSEPVNKDWMIRFINSIEDISDEDMQKLWGRILAGEIKQPNNCSLRTLERLRNMSKVEKELFEDIASIVLYSDDNAFIDNEFVEKYGFKFENILKLEECGLVSAHSTSLRLIVNANKSECIHNAHDIIGFVKTDNVDTIYYIYDAYLLNECGKQLCRIIDKRTNSDCIFEALRKINAPNNAFYTTAHNIKSISKDYKIDYFETNILE